MEIEPQGEGKYPWIGATGDGDMQDTKPLGEGVLQDGREFVVVHKAIYDMLVRAVQPDA